MINHTAVTVLGLGDMGSAIGHALLGHGLTTTVWNRTRDKAEPLIAAGALLAPSPAAAVAASPVTVICVSDYAATQEILGTPAAADAIRDRVLVQLTTGTPQDARQASDWAMSNGARYVDGGILAWPRQMGGDSATVVVSGRGEDLAEARPILAAAAGNVLHIGEPIAGASALFAAILAYLAGRWIGFSHGALICETEGLDVVGFGTLLADMAPVLAQDDRHMGEVVGHDRYDAPESALRTAGTDIAKLVRHAEQTGISGDFPRFAADLFGRAIEAGHGAEEHVALLKVLRCAQPIAS